jgi:hypothetical protein
MALPITGSDQQPIVKYNAKSAKWKVDDTLLNDITMIVDMRNAEVGWMRFTEGLAPAFHMVPAVKLASGTPFPTMPSDTDATGKPLFKRGFRVTVKVADRLVGKGQPTVREWASNSLATCRGFNALHDLWLAAPESGNPGLAPVVKMTSVTEISGQYGSNYQPVFVIKTWVPRPKDLTLRLDGAAPAAAVDDDPLDDSVEDLIAVPGEPEMRDADAPEDFSDL